MTDSKSYRTSPSQISTAEDCLRKWALTKIEKVPVKPNKYAAHGTRTHAYLDKWFEQRIPPHNDDEGNCARAILQHLPPPQTPGLEVEQWMSITLGGVQVKGRIDLRDLTLDVPFVSDHKTTSDLCWAKEPDDLVDDVQATIYAYDAMVKTNKKECQLQWTYSTRHKKPKTKKVVRLVTLQEITPRLEASAKTAAMLQEVWNAQPSWQEVPYDASACEKYGGCPFRDSHCKLTPEERIQSIMAQETEHSAFLAKLRNKRAQNGAPAAAEPPTEIHPPPAGGGINPPATPTAAPPPAPPAPEPEAAPEPEPSKPKKPRGRPRKKKTTAKAADAPAQESTATAAAEPAPAPSQKVQAALPVEAAPVAGNILELLNAQYRAGFVEGFRMGKGES